VRQGYGSIFERLSKGLQTHWDALAKEALPERWIDLIRYLDEKERGEGKTRELRGSAASSHQRQEVSTMTNASQIKEHMEVKGSDGKHVGTVLGVENGRLKLASGGIDHVIDIAMVDAIENDAVRLRKTAEEAVRTWH
jgi:hypothetical protein